LSWCAYEPHRPRGYGFQVGFAFMMAAAIVGQFLFLHALDLTYY
jgi:hypothetical protein